MGERTVRLLADDELPTAAAVISRQMLVPINDEVSEGWAELFRGQGCRTHGALVDGEVVGVAQWFPTELSIPGTPLSAAAVTGVAVLSNHRRRGHLTALMRAQLDDAVEAGHPLAVLVAAEHPIYGRFGYGHAVDAVELRLDLGTARFRAPASGSISFADPATARPALEAAYRASWERTPGALTRVSDFWDLQAGLRALPGKPLEPGVARAALWHDDGGTVRGVATYRVEERWTHGVPDGVVTVEHLYGATPEAERELWRHITTIDWARSAKAGLRAVDDPLPLWLEDGRSARASERSDHMWVRLLDLPAAFAARRSALAGSVVLEVTDPLGHVDGTWSIELGPDGGAAARSDETPEVRVTASALGAAYLGGQTLLRLADGGQVEELQPGALAVASALLHTAVAPWCPIEF